jgi:hypothetical protein
MFIDEMSETECRKAPEQATVDAVLEFAAFRAITDRC